MADWLSVVDECKINTSTEIISNKLKDIVLDANREIISFDVTSLYTHVPVNEAIRDSADMLFSNKYKKPPVTKETFIQLASVCSCDVIMLTCDGLYKQKDGLAMGSPPAPHFANDCLHKFDNKIKGDAVLYERYMDDILRDIKTERIDEKLDDVNSYHANLKFTIEKEKINIYMVYEINGYRLNHELPLIGTE